jgi:hypothetical protein
MMPDTAVSIPARCGIQARIRIIHRSQPGSVGLNTVGYALVFMGNDDLRW